MKAAALYRELPGIDELLRDSQSSALAAEEGQSTTTDACRVVLARLREEIAAGHLDETNLRLALAGIYDAIRNELSRSLKYSLRPVINATGVVLHTNLGRAPLPPSAIDHIRETATSYSNLEFNLESGERGKRDVHVDRLFRKLLSTEHVGTAAPGSPDEQRSAISTIVVNN